MHEQRRSAVGTMTVQPQHLPFYWLTGIVNKAFSILQQGYGTESITCNHVILGDFLKSS